MSDIDHLANALTMLFNQRATESREQRRFDAAKAAMQGILSAPWSSDMGMDWRRPADEVANGAVAYADALLAALDRPAAQEAASE